MRLIKSFGLYRFMLTSLFLTLATTLVLLSNYVFSTGETHLWLEDLGKEAIGVVFTVATLDWLQDMRQAKTAARNMALEVLHQLDYVVWVWQGGDRAPNINELVALLDAADPEDHVAWFVENMLIRLGSRSAETLARKDDSLEANDHLRRALTVLTPLAGVRDSGRPRLEIAMILKEAAVELQAATAGAPPVSNGPNNWKRDPSFRAQYLRYNGRPPLDSEVRDAEAKQAALGR